MAGRANAFLSGLTGGMTAMNSMLASRDRREALKLQTQLAQKERDDKTYINTALAVNSIQNSFETPEQKKQFQGEMIQGLDKHYGDLLQRHVEPGTRKGISGYRFNNKGRVEMDVGTYKVGEDGQYILDENGKRTGLIRTGKLSDQGMNDGSDRVVDMDFTDFLDMAGRTKNILPDALTRAQVISRGGKLPTTKEEEDTYEQLGYYTHPGTEEKSPIIRRGNDFFIVTRDPDKGGVTLSPFNQYGNQVGGGGGGDTGGTSFDEMFLGKDKGNPAQEPSPAPAGNPGKRAALSALVNKGPVRYGQLGMQEGIDYGNLSTLAPVVPGRKIPTTLKPGDIRGGRVAAGTTGQLLSQAKQKIMTDYGDEIEAISRGLSRFFGTDRSPAPGSKKAQRLAMQRRAKGGVRQIASAGNEGLSPEESELSAEQLQVFSQLSGDEKGIFRRAAQLVKKGDKDAVKKYLSSIDPSVRKKMMSLFFAKNLGMQA